MIVPDFWVYAITFNFKEFSVEDLTRFLNTRAEVRNWMAFFPGQILVVSNVRAGDLTKPIETMFPGKLFMVAEIDATNTTGLMPPPVWEFINRPVPSGYDYVSSVNQELHRRAMSHRLSDPER